MLKKIGIYCAFIIFGLLLGYIFFMPKKSILVDPDTSTLESIGKWTCSMHPEVVGEENGSCPLCNMDLVYVEAGINDGPSKSQFKMTKEAVALANIETYSIAKNTSISRSIVLSGKITTNKETDAVQTTLFDGRLDKFYSNSVGKKVRRGQEIGLIYSPELYLAQDKLLTSASYKDSHQKLYAAARNTLGLWKMTDKQIDTMLLTGKPIINFPLVADVRGTIVEVLAKKGHYYSKGDPLFKTSDLRTVWAVFDAYENQLNFLKVGQEIEINLLNITGHKITSKITFIEPILDDIKRTALVRVVINNSNGLLKPGMLIEASIKETINEDNNILTIPKSAVLWTGKRSVVYIKPYTNQSIFEMIEVELGPLMGNEYQVVSGLNFGDVIVSEGTFTVDAAAQLSGQKSMMSKDKKLYKKSKLNEMNIGFKSKMNKINFNNGVELLLKDYMLLKDALVYSDTNLIKINSKKLSNIIGENESVKVLKSKTSAIGEIAKRLQKIQSSQDIEKQREEFKYLSESMLEIVSLADEFKSPVYVQHCDCVDNFTGGSWLSFNENILNPYFGDKMLVCGKVERILN